MNHSISLNIDPHGEQSLLQTALDQVPDGTEVRLPRGIYCFSPDFSRKFSCSLSNSDPVPLLSAGLMLEGRENLVLDGQNSTLLCHGQMLCFALLHCKNITLQNFMIDWDIPLTAEGLITASCETFTDIQIDSEKYPFHVDHGTLYFDGGDWTQKLHVWGHTEFDPHTDCLARNRGDRFPPTVQSLLPDGQIRFTGDFTDRIPTPGNILVLRHGERISPSLLIHHCRNISLRNVTIHASGGLGILAQFSDTLTFSHVNLVPNRAAGRHFAGLHDDGIHLSADSGEILVENCSFLGLMDDPVNLHGIALKAETQPKGDTVRGKFMHPQSKAHGLWAEPGHTVAFLNGDTMEEVSRAEVKNFRLLDAENFEIQFTSSSHVPVLQSLPSFSLENLSRTASLICRKNHFGACRARGLLVTTPKPVRIEENEFFSPGAAILIAGDVCTWYESGRCRDVVICGNTFSDTCLSNSYQGGQGVISISPELPCPDIRFPCHRNIRITHNRFCTSDERLLYALCTDGLTFSHNQIIKSKNFPFSHSSHSFVTLEHCRNVLVSENEFLGF